MKICNLPKQTYSVMIVPIPECIIGIDILRGLTLYLPDGKYQFGTRTYILAQPILVGKVTLSAGLIERMNGLLKEQLKKLGEAN